MNFSEDFKLTGEKKLLKLLQKSQPIRLALDIGANRGQWAEMALLTSVEKVISFEPQVIPFNVLAALSDIYPQRLEVHNFALGKLDQTLKMYVHDSSSELSFISSEITELPLLSGRTSTFQEINIKTLDGLYNQDKEKFTEVDFIKIDTFGNELKVLMGARELLLRCKPLVQVALTDYKWNQATNVVEFMSQNGFKVLDIVNNVAFFWVPEKCDNLENNTLYCFWTGTNPMTPNRLGCLYNLRTQTDANVVLVTVDNLPSFIKPEDPLHEAYQYLSETHKCDYLRIYFMHHYGGGYSDIKSPRRSWAEAFKQMRDDPTKIINGYKEKGEWAIAYRPAADKWAMLCGNGSYILRPKTVFLIEGAKNSLRIEMS
jgi:FkbM family methyltransferase